MKKSVLQGLYPDAVEYKQINQCEVPVVYTSVSEEYDTLRHKIGIIDGVGYSILRVAGEQAAEFLDSLVTKDIEYLNPGKISECLFLNEQAEALGIAYIINNEDDFIVLVPPENGEAITNWVVSKNDGRATVTDMTENWSLAFIEGEKSWKIVKEMFDFPVETLPLRDMVKVAFHANNFLLSRIGRSGEYGYAFLGAHATVLEIVKSCLDQYKDAGMAFCGTEALSICMLEITQPQISPETAKEGTILELAQQWFIQFDKEDYCGYNALMEEFQEGQKKNSVGFLAKDVLQLPPSTKIFLGDDQVGKVLYGKYDPALQGVLGMALVNNEVAVSGIPLSVEIDGKKADITTLSSPFVRPLSWDAQME